MNIIDQIAAAGRARKTIVIQYRKSNGQIIEREVEPYSLKQSSTSILLFGFDLQKQERRSFKVTSIIRFQQTERSFQPRFPVEF